MRTQDQIGLDLLTDGEQRRTGFINHILAAFDGIDLTHEAVKRSSGAAPTERSVPRVVGKIKRGKPAIVDDLRFAKTQDTKPIKMAVPGPMTVIDSTLDEAYRRRSHGHGRCGAQRRVARSPAAGCDVVQIDEPAMTRYEKVFEYGARALDRCLEGIQIPSIVHLCYGYPGGAGQQHEYEYPNS